MRQLALLTGRLVTGTMPDLNMAIVNTQKKEILLKLIVDGPYCVSPGDVLKQAADLIEEQMRSDIVESLTGSDRVAQLEIHSEELELIPGFDISIRIFAPLGNPYYQATRDLVYRDADGLVLALDRSQDRQEDNEVVISRIASAMENNHRDFEMFPMTLQFFDPNEGAMLSSEEMLSRYQSSEWFRPWVETKKGAEDGLLVSFDHLCLEVTKRFRAASKREPALDRFQSAPIFRVAKKG